MAAMAGLVVPSFACGDDVSGQPDATTDDGADDAPVDPDDGADTGTDDGADTGEPNGPPRGEPQWAFERAELRRLTAAQYARTVQTLLSPDDPSRLDDALADLPDDLVLSLFADVGASAVESSSLAVERYEDAALAATELVFEDLGWAQDVLGCDPSELGCPETFVDGVGRRAWRRTLMVAERLRYLDLFDRMRDRFDDPWIAARFVVSALMTSPYFMYRVEVGEPDPSDETGTRWRYTSVEMASRLSYLLWDGPPDETLLELGEQDMLVQPDVVAEQAARLLADPRARPAVGRFFEQWLGLAATDALVKDPEVFPAASPSLYAAMRGEVERLVQDVVFERDGSLAELLSTRETFATDELAALYDVPPGDDPDADGFSAVTLPADGDRAGMLGTAAMLAANARVTRTSPTLRGLFVRQRLLCENLPPPPPDVDAELPEPGGSDGPQTMRERLAQHNEDPACAGCHQTIDPLGLALEHYDGLGRYRDTDQGLALDVSGDLDGASFEGRAGLVDTLQADPRLTACLARQVYRYATGHVEGADEAGLVASLTGSPQTSVLDAWAAVATSPGFRFKGAAD